MRITLALGFVALASALPAAARAQRYLSADGRLRVALAEQPFSPTGTSVGPNTMATGGIQDTLATLGATVRIDEARLTATQDTGSTRTSIRRSTIATS